MFMHCPKLADLTSTAKLGRGERSLATGVYVVFDGHLFLTICTALQQSRCAAAGLEAAEAALLVLAVKGDKIQVAVGRPPGFHHPQQQVQAQRLRQLPSLRLNWANPTEPCC
jgi:hypothetical protein